MRRAPSSTPMSCATTRVSVGCGVRTFFVQKRRRFVFFFSPTPLPPTHSGRSKGWGIVEFESIDEALSAITTLNGVELEGRKLLVRERVGRKEGVENKKTINPSSDPTPPTHPPCYPQVREDREDRDIKGPRAAGEGGDRPPRERRERAPRERRPRPPREDRPEATSGLQVVVQGLPWAYTWKELKPLFEEYGDIERADVVIGRDGRSRGYGTVRFVSTAAAEAAIAAKTGTELEGRSLTVKLDRFA